MAVPDEHYVQLGNQILAGKVIPFLGAGVNLAERGARAWQRGHDLPSGEELADELAMLHEYPERDPGRAPDLLRVAQYVGSVLGDGPLYESLHTIFAIPGRPSRLHRFLADLPPLLRERGKPQQLIITTNYDDLLEQAFATRGEPFDLVWYEAKTRESGWRRLRHRAPDGATRVIQDPGTYYLTTRERPVILKIHGAVDRHCADDDSFVITEDNYIDYLSHADAEGPIPQTLRALMMSSHFLFLGYSLRDWNLRVLLNRMWGEQELTWQSWAVQRNPDRVEERLWRRRGEVELLYEELRTYVTRLADTVARPAPADMVR